MIQAPAPPAQVGQGDEGGMYYRQIQDDLNDLTHLLAFKEKRILQAEAGWDYRVCEQVTKEIVELNSRKHQLEEEKLGFEKNTWANARLALESDGSMGSSS